MEFQTEKTMLLYVKLMDNQEIKQIMDISNISYYINIKTNSVCVWIDNKIESLGIKLKRFNLDITNDPKTDPKYNITNLSYYSIRLTGTDCEVYHINNKTLLKFPINKFMIEYNLSIFLPQINNKNFRELFMFKNKDMFVRLEFKNNNHDINAFVWEDEKYLNFRFDLLKIENNYKFIKSERIFIENILDKFNLT